LLLDVWFVNKLKINLDIIILILNEIYLLKLIIYLLIIVSEIILIRKNKHNLILLFNNNFTLKFLASIYFKP
jgi:hypothetical protein